MGGGADFLKQAGADGHATVFDLAEQIDASSGRDRADRVLHGIVGRLPGDNAKALLGGTPPATRPLGVLTAELSDDSKAPLFKAAAGPKMQAMATAQASKPGGDDVLTVPASAPAEPGAQAPDPQKPVQTAWVGPAVQAVRTIGPLLLPLLGGAIQTMQGQQAEKPQGQNTTVAEPEAGTPPVLTGPDATKPPPQQGTPPSQKPKPVPAVPPSTQQIPPAQGNSLPGRPAEPVPPMGPVEIRRVAPIDHSKGGKPHPTTQQGLEQIPDQDARKIVEKAALSGGVTNGADSKATNVEGAGDYDTAKQAQTDLARQLGISSKQIKPFANGQPGEEFTTPDGRLTVGVRPSSRSEAPTLEVQVKDEKGNVTYQIKRRYKR